VIDPNALIAVSVSAPLPSEMVALGLSDLHVRYAFTELVRRILADGGCVAYGGRLDDVNSEQPNFTRIMLEMVAGYRPDQRPDHKRLVNFAASVFWRNPDGTDKADFRELVRPYTGRFQVEHCGTDLQRDPALVPPAAAASALSFTSMRERMATECAARIILGGTLVNYGGRYPGVIEEALLTVDAKRPLYVVGGFGGCGAALARHLRGDAVEELTQEWQVAHTPALAERAAELAPTPYRLDLDGELAGSIPRGDLSVLRNGLSDEDNNRLGVTMDADEVVALVMRGLRVVAPPPPRA